MIKSKLIQTIGLLNEDYFAYWEDTDYSISRFKNWFKNILCIAAKIYHKTNIICDNNEE